jgi:hypothetical protein
VVQRIDCAEGYRTGLLTNSFGVPRSPEAHVDFGALDVIVDSSEVGLRKPEPEIYALTTEMLECPPTRSGTSTIRRQSGRCRGRRVADDPRADTRR